MDRSQNSIALLDGLAVVPAMTPIAERRFLAALPVAS
jgi:hypothetical protein